MSASVLRARRFLEKALAQPPFSQGGRMPRLKELAKMAGVSHGAMGEALKALSKQGLLVMSRKGGIHALPSADHSQTYPNSNPFLDGATLPQTTPVEPLASRLQAELESELLHGALIDSQGYLPNAFALSLARGVGYRSMRLAFKGLEKSGLVRKDKHGWRLSNFQTSRYGTVWVIGPSDAAGHFSFDGDRQGAFVEALRQQATDRGVTLRFIGSDRLQDRRPVSSDEIPIGVIVWADGYTHSSLTKILERISHRLRQGPSLPPLVLFSSVPIETENWGVKHFPRFRFLHLASHSAGQAMGDLLRQNGFRDIAFLSPCLDEKWSQQRQKGLAVSLKKGGLPPLKVAGLSGSYQPLELHALHENAKKGFTALKALTHLRIPQSADHLYHLSEGLLHHALEILRQDLYYRRLIPQMKALLSDKRIGVWVCANDTTASIALAFLRSQGIKVPREMSLVSFDNRLHSVAADLTTFDFRIDRAASMALGYLLYPDAKPYRHLLHVEVPGSVIIRGSLKRTNGITPSKR